MRKLALFLSMILFVGLQTLSAQTKAISGKVVDDLGEAIPGVSIIVKGTTTGTISRPDGTYSFNVPEDATAIIFTFVGMTLQEVPYTGQTTINVTMESDSKDLDEVVVTAMGIVREKRTTTYQTEKVKSEELLVGQSSKAAEGLTGKVAGLQINNQDNGVNPKKQILLRGMRSISGNNEALIVIDGSVVTSGAFNDLNPNDIESINILKGASAAALYGSRAANGALIVVTKQGKKGKKLTLGINHSSSWESVAYMPDFQSEYGEGWDGEDNPIENTNWGARFDGVVKQIGPTFADGSYQAVAYAPIKDNLKDFYNTGVTNQTTAYLSGGDETSTFYLSLGKTDADGIVPSDEYSRYTARVNVSKQIGSVKLSANTSFLTDKTDVVGDKIGDQDRPLYWFVLNTPANIPLSDYRDWDNPESYGYADNYFNAYYQNPYWAIGTNRNVDETNRFVGNVSASWDIFDNINLTGRLGANNSWGNGKDWRAEQTYDATLQPYHSTVSSFVEDFEFQRDIYTTDVILSGDFDLASDFTLKAILGSSTYSYKYRESTLIAKNLSIPGFYDISNGTGQLEGQVDQSEKRTYGFYGDFTFGYKNWAFLTLTGRQDYTSTLSSDNNSYFYPAVGLSLVLTDAIEALKNNDVLSYAKLTLSNSTVYNDLNPYQINERYYKRKNSAGDVLNPFPYGSINGFDKSASAVNSDIRKEKLNTTEVGMNLGFFGSRINLDASYYHTKTTDLITYTTPSYTSGASSYLTNIGQLSGKGFELSLGGRVVNLGDFKWDLNINFSTQTTKVDEIIDGVNEVALDSYTSGYGTYAVVGDAFPQIKAVSYVRHDGKVVVDSESGDPIVGEIENKGRTTPKYIYGLTTQFSYKGLKLSTTWDLRTDYVYYAQGLDAMEFTGRTEESVRANRQDFVWPNSVYETSPGVYVDNTNVAITNGVGGFWRDKYGEINESYIRNASNLKIRELALSYDLPKSILSKTNIIKKMTVGIVARNLYTWFPDNQTRFSDPEFRNTDSGDDANGVGIGGYFTSPPTRSFGFNVNIEF